MAVGMVWRFLVEDSTHVVSYETALSARLPETVVLDGDILNLRWERPIGSADGAEKVFRFQVARRRAVLHWSHFVPAAAVIAARRTLWARVLEQTPFHEVVTTEELLGNLWLTIDGERIHGDAVGIGWQMDPPSQRDPSGPTRGSTYQVRPPLSFRPSTIALLATGILWGEYATSPLGWAFFAAGLVILRVFGSGRWLALGIVWVAIALLSSLVFAEIR